MRNAKKYGKQYEIKILFRHVYCLKALVSIDELKKKWVIGTLRTYREYAVFKTREGAFYHI